MHKYEKMLNLFKFDEATKGRRREFSCPEFEFLANVPWIWTEKIDGTNIRVIFDSEGGRTVKGRTDKAILKEDLVAAVMEATCTAELTNCTLYGEGYGAGIQKVGRAYLPETKGFLLFDIFKHTGLELTDPAELTTEMQGYYLPWQDVCQIAAAYNIPRVPQYGVMTPWEAYEAVHLGLISEVAPGELHAEGIVGRPAVPLSGIKGQRLIVKVKHRDYYGKELVE